MKKSVAYLGVFLALAMILSYVEAILPFAIGIPGVKLGLANLVTVLMLYLIGWREALCVSVLRIVLTGILFGNLVSICYGLAGGLLSFVLMFILIRMNCFHVVTVSICGGIIHNMGQLIVAGFLVSSYYVIYYMPVLLIAGFVTGALIGIVAKEVGGRYIKGELSEIVAENHIVVENGGIGYNIYIPGQVLSLLPGVGEEVKIYTYLCVREDAFILYGFLTRDDLNVFKLLIGVSGIGPKGALAILSVMSTDDLRFAVLSDDAKAIAKAPGVGNKTAQRLIIELKDKLSLEDAFEQKLSHTQEAVSGNGLRGIRNEAVEALVSLGYSSTEALKVLRDIEITEDSSVEDILKLALKQMAFL